MKNALKRAPFKKMNQLKRTDFSKRFQSLVERYNEPKENDILNGKEFDGFTQEVTDMIYSISSEMTSFTDPGIDMEEKAFLDILKHMCEKYVFTYDEAKMLELARAMKTIVEDTSQYPDWSNRDDIKAQLKMDLILLLHKFGFPPVANDDVHVANDDVYKGVLEQAVSFKANR